MNKDENVGNCKVLTGKIKEQWSDIADDELFNIEGRKDPILGPVQKIWLFKRPRRQRS